MRICFVSTCLFLAVIGCGQDRLNGLFSGQFTVRRAGTTSTQRVEADVEGRIENLAFTMRAVDTNRVIGEVSVRARRLTKTVEITSDLFPDRQEIALAAGGTCAASSSSAPYQAELCLTGGVLHLAFHEGDNHLYLQAYEGGSNSGHQLPPGIYTLDQLVEVTKDNNLDVLLKAQDVYRAREELLLRRGNLFPNFNLGTILAAAEGPLGLLSQMGNLLPFLFPDNWYRANASADLQHAQEFSYQALKANQVAIVAGVFLTTLKDLSFKSAIQAHLADLNDILSKVLALISAGQAPTSWEPIVRMKMIEDQEDLLSYEQYLVEQIVDLQKLLGNVPTRDGISLAALPLPALDPSVVRDLSPEEAEAIAKSLEIKETIHLESAARHLTHAAMWSWLNPNTDPRFNMGMGWEHAVAIERSHIEDIRLKRTEVDHDIRGNIIDIENGIEFLVENYELAAQGERAAHAALAIALKQFEQGQLGLLDTIEFIEQLFKYRVKKTAAQYSYLIIQEKLNRHTLGGYYADLPVPTFPSE